MGGGSSKISPLGNSHGNHAKKYRELFEELTRKRVEVIKARERLNQLKAEKAEEEEEYEIYYGEKFNPKYDSPVPSPRPTIAQIPNDFMMALKSKDLTTSQAVANRRELERQRASPLQMEMEQALQEARLGIMDSDSSSEDRKPPARRGRGR